MLTVLVCDDEFAVLEVLAMALESEGHRVVRASDGAEAWRLLEGGRCDVVVADQTMPVVTGSELVARMRADIRFARIPVILMAETPGADVAATLLAKPIRLSELLAQVRSAGNSRRSA